MIFRSRIVGAVALLALALPSQAIAQDSYLERVKPSPGAECLAKHHREDLNAFLEGTIDDIVLEKECVDLVRSNRSRPIDIEYLETSVRLMDAYLSWKCALRSSLVLSSLGQLQADLDNRYYVDIAAEEIGTSQINLGEYYIWLSKTFPQKQNVIDAITPCFEANGVFYSLVDGSAWTSRMLDLTEARLFEVPN